MKHMLVLDVRSCIVYGSNYGTVSRTIQFYKLTELSKNIDNGNDTLNQYVIYKININPSPPGQNDRHRPNDIFWCIFVN